MTLKNRLEEMTPGVETSDVEEEGRPSLDVQSGRSASSGRVVPVRL